MLIYGISLDDARVNSMFTGNIGHLYRRQETCNHYRITANTVIIGLIGHLRCATAIILKLITGEMITLIIPINVLTWPELTRILITFSGTISVDNWSEFTVRFRTSIHSVPKVRFACRNSLILINIML